MTDAQLDLLHGNREFRKGYALHYKVQTCQEAKTIRQEMQQRDITIVHAYLKADCMVEAIIKCDKNDKKERNLRSFVINNVAPSNFYAARSGGE